MKKFLILTTFFISLFFACAQESKELRIVQQGRFDDFEFTIKQMIESNWENVEWHVNDGAVSVTGELEDDGRRTKYALEFSVDTAQKSFDFESLFIDNEEADDFTTMMILTIMALTTAIALDGNSPE